MPLEIIMAGGTPRCLECDGLVKPSIVFFGEALPERFFTCAKSVSYLSFPISWSRCSAPCVDRTSQNVTC
jgi:NAD-dependent SIR2 family protein deacetylase